MTDNKQHSSTFVLMLLIGWLCLGAALGYGALTAFQSQAGSAAQPRTTVESTFIPPTGQPTVTELTIAQPIEPSTTTKDAKSSALAPTAVENDVVASPESLDTLGGTHGITTDLIGWTIWGTAEVTENGDGSLTIQGSQVTSEESLTIDGVLRIDTSERLLFDGVIESRTGASGRLSCIRNGEMIFEAPENKQYWRLIEDQNPCGDYTERIDIYFAGL